MGNYYGNVTQFCMHIIQWKKYNYDSSLWFFFFFYSLENNGWCRDRTHCDTNIILYYIKVSSTPPKIYESDE